MPTPRIVVADNVETENEEIYFSSRIDNSIKRNGKLVSFSLIRADLLAVDGVLGYYITFVSPNLSDIHRPVFCVRFLEDYLIHSFSINTFRY